MKRSAYNDLLRWRAQKNRKPLIVNGVRQCGKTYLLKHFGASEFAHTHYLNFEEEPQLCDLFTQDLNPKRLLADFEFHFDTSINQHTDLIILDEIQACPPALTSLKYFCENMPHLAIACAGSLLGLQLGQSSFPVGKIEMMPLHPMSFTEFLTALEDSRALGAIDTYLSKKTALSEIAHSHLFQRFKQYLIVGGLPEAVHTFCSLQDDLYTALQGVRQQQQTLINAYLADIAKHSGKENSMHIERVWKGAVAQLAQAQDDRISRFKFKGVIPGISHYDRLAGAIDWLCACGLTRKIAITHSAQLPLSAFTKENQFKLFIFDTGILGALAGLSPKTILDYDYGTYKGFMVENFVAQELLCTGHTNLFSWKENQAEIDFLYERDGRLVPIEVKSGKTRQGKSLSQFCKKYHTQERVILNALKPRPPHTLPLYLTGKLWTLLENKRGYSLPPSPST